MVSVQTMYFMLNGIYDSTENKERRKAYFLNISLAGKLELGLNLTASNSDKYCHNTQQHKTL